MQLRKFPNLLIYLFLLVPLSIPLPGRLSSLVVVCLVVLSVYLTVISINKNGFVTQLKSPIMVLIGLQLLIVLVGLVHSPDLKRGWEDIERAAFLAASGLIIMQMKDLGSSVFKSILAFSIGCFSIALVGIVIAFPSFVQSIQMGGFQEGHTAFAEAMDVHPTYLSIYFTFIFFFLTELVRTRGANLSPYWRTGIYAAAFFSVASVLLLRSKMGLLVFAILLVIYGIVILKRRAWLVTFGLFTLGLLTFLLDPNRMATVFDTYGKDVSSALDQRFQVWRGAVEAIKTAPVFGAGTGGQQQLINEGYEKIGFAVGITNQYNAHNQYMQFQVRNGLLELGCFLVFLFYCFRKSLTMDNYVFLMFNMAVTLIMFAESFLSAQKGIMFYYYFSLAFVLLPEKPKDLDGQQI